LLEYCGHSSKLWGPVVPKAPLGLEELEFIELLLILSECLLLLRIVNRGETVLVHKICKPVKTFSMAAVEFGKVCLLIEFVHIGRCLFRCQVDGRNPMVARQLKSAPVMRYYDSGRPGENCCDVPMDARP